MRVTITESNKNIHLHFYSEDVEDTDPDTLFVKLDINNKDQISGLNENSYDEIINFADNYVKNKLIDVLNTNFG